MARYRGVCIGAGYFSKFQYEAWNRIPEVRITAIAPDAIAAPVPDARRLERGPAYSEIPDLGPQISRPADWPTYRHDIGRSGYLPQTIDAATLASRLATVTDFLVRRWSDK